jgi:hypothetical protein
MKIAAFNEWEKTLPEDKRGIIKYMRETLMANLNNLGELSASELLAEIFLKVERSERNVTKR